MKQPFFNEILPLPPSVNHYWGKTVQRAKGRYFVKVYLTQNAKNFRAEVVNIIAKFGSIKTRTGRIRADIVVYPKSNAKMDLDNVCKGLFDALTHARVYKDDSQIDGFTIMRGKVIKGGAVQIALYEME